MDYVLQNKVMFGGIVLGIFGMKYGIPNMRYVAQVLNLGLITAMQKGSMLPSDMTDLEFTVSLTDIDFMRHMNNSAYLRYAEAARHQWFLRIMNQIKNKLNGKRNNINIPLIAISVKYRRECKFNDTFIIQTKAVYWDQCNIYLKQEFFNKKSKQMHCILYAKLGFVKNGKFVKTMDDEQGGFHSLEWYKEKGDFDDVYKCRNELSDELKAWINHLTQTKLKSKL
eukprot:367601_1